MSIWDKIADLEQNDPEIARLSATVTRAGLDTETPENRAFNAAIARRLDKDTP